MWQRLIPIIKNNVQFDYVKAPKIDDRKRHCISLILCRLRSSICRQISRKPNCTLFLIIGIIPFLILFASLTAEEHCFILFNEKTDQIANIEGTGYDKRVSPCSTFKIVLSLIGYDTQILINENTPIWPYEGYEVHLESWKTAQTPKTWMNHSVIWYSQILSSLIGLNHLEQYLAKFDYGNQDMKGDRGKNNGLTHAWLNSSLKISPLEQIHFLKKFVREELPVSMQALEMTKNLLHVEELEEGWKLYGKGGAGYEKNDDGVIQRDKNIAWFVGWIEKEEQKYIFSINILNVPVIPTTEERINTLKKFLKESKIL